MTRYRHALWPPSEKWPDGYIFGAPVPDFKRAFPAKVKELGVPLKVWESEDHAGDVDASGAPA